MQEIRDKCVSPISIPIEIHYNEEWCVQCSYKLMIFYYVLFIVDEHWERQIKCEWKVNCDLQLCAFVSHTKWQETILVKFRWQIVHHSAIKRIHGLNERTNNVSSLIRGMRAEAFGQTKRKRIDWIFARENRFKCNWCRNEYHSNKQTFAIVQTNSLLTSNATFSVKQLRVLTRSTQHIKMINKIVRHITGWNIKYSL